MENVPPRQIASACLRACTACLLPDPPASPARLPAPACVCASAHVCSCQVRRRLPKRVYVPLPDADGRRAMIAHLLRGQRHRLSQRDLEHVVAGTGKHASKHASASCPAQLPARPLPAAACSLPRAHLAAPRPGHPTQGSTVLPALACAACLSACLPTWTSTPLQRATAAATWQPSARRQQWRRSGSWAQPSPPPRPTR